jgi:hypothetical protein
VQHAVQTSRAPPAQPVYKQVATCCRHVHICVVLCARTGRGTNQHLHAHWWPLAHPWGGGGGAPTRTVA